LRAELAAASEGAEASAVALRDELQVPIARDRAREVGRGRERARESERERERES